MTVTMVEVAMMMMTMMMMTMVLEEAMKEGWALGINPLIVTIGARVMMKKIIFMMMMMMIIKFTTTIIPPSHNCEPHFSPTVNKMVTKLMMAITELTMMRRMF